MMAKITIDYHHPELGLEGQLSWEDLGAQWEHNLHELSPHVKKCGGADSATDRLKDMGIPQVKCTNQLVPMSRCRPTSSDADAG